MFLRETRVELNCWLDKEDLMWKQGLRLNWFRDGDRNIGYFHSKASNRFQKNLIDGLLDQNGCWQELEKEIERIVLDYYSNLFKSLGPRDFFRIGRSC